MCCVYEQVSALFKPLNISITLLYISCIVDTGPCLLLR